MSHGSNDAKNKEASKTVGPLAQLALTLIAGGGAGAVSKTVVAPLERLKVLLQVQHVTKHLQAQTEYKGVIDGMLGIYRNEGFKAYWKGNMANCVRIIPTCAIKFTCFDYLKDLFAPPKGASYLTQIASKIAAGGASGMITLACVYPIEVVKTRLTASQARNAKDAMYTGMLDCFVKMARTEGIKTLYKGFAPSLLGIIPYLGFNFAIFDSLKTMIPSKKKGGHSPVTLLLMGAASGMFAQTITFPMDTVRNRLQVDGWGGKPKKYNGTLDCYAKIFREEGTRAFFKGCLVNLIKAGPSVAIEFYGYEILKKLFFKSADYLQNRYAQYKESKVEKKPAAPVAPAAPEPAKQH